MILKQTYKLVRMKYKNLTCSQYNVLNTMMYMYIVDTMYVLQYSAHAKFNLGTVQCTMMYICTVFCPC